MEAWLRDTTTQDQKTLARARIVTIPSYHLVSGAPHDAPDGTGPSSLGSSQFSGLALHHRQQTLMD